MRLLKSWVVWIAIFLIACAIMAWVFVPEWLWRKFYLINKDFTAWITASPPAVISLVAVLTSLIVLLTTLTFQKRFFQRSSVLEMLKLWTQEPLRSSRRNAWNYLMTLGDGDVIDMARLKKDDVVDEKAIAYQISQVFEFFANLRHLVNSGHADRDYAACVFQHYWAGWSDYLLHMLFEVPPDLPRNGLSATREEIYYIKKWYREHVSEVGHDVFGEPAIEFPNFQVITRDEELYWSQKAQKRDERVRRMHQILSEKSGHSA